MNLRIFWAVLKEAVNEFLQDRAMRLAAATAYYAVFSIGPLLVLVIGLAGLVFGEEAVRKAATEQIRAFVGDKAAILISTMMSAHQKSGTLLATILGAAALVIGATGAFGQLQDSLNTIWGVTPRPGASIGAFLRDRVFSMAMVLGVGFVLLVSMALSAFVVSFAGYIGNLIALPSWLVPAFNGLADFVVIALLFALIFKVLPDVRIRWRDVWVGAGGTAVLFTIGKYVLSVYLAREATASAYGAGSALVVVLLYIYYASIILYFGAEFTQVYAHRRGARLIPSKYAVHITDKDRAEQGMPSARQIHEAVRRAARAESASARLIGPADGPCPQVSDQDVVFASPWSFVGLAFAVGAMAGAVWRGKSFRKEETRPAAHERSETAGPVGGPCPARSPIIGPVPETPRPGADDRKPLPNRPSPKRNSPRAATRGPWPC